MKVLNSLFLSALLALGVGLSRHSQAEEPWFSQAELDQMLAPIALYPDTVLSHVLIAATYPLEVIQAARWSRANPALSGEDAVAAVEGMDWDPSVMALVAFPELLKRLDEDLEWTHRLGDAFLVQEDQVVDTIQQLRARAYAQGNLKTNEHVRVVRETQYIYIEPARTRVVYVPYYDPRVVYGSWWWSAYPPVYWHHPPRYVSGIHFYWGPAYRVAPAFYFSSFHWSRRQVVVVHHHHHHHHRPFRSGREVARYSNARHWQHNPHHRRGVSYHQGVSERRFVQQSNDRGQRQVPARAMQQRETQRGWAADRRQSLDLQSRNRESSARTPRADTSARQQRSVTDARQTARENQSVRQSRTEPSLDGARRTPEASPQRNAGNAGQVRERLAGGESGSRTSRSPESAQRMGPAERSAPSRSPTTERAVQPTERPAIPRQAPTADRQRSVERPAIPRQAPASSNSTRGVQPAASARSQPVAPARSQPATSVRTQPSAPARSQPSAPARSQPVAPSRSAPASAPRQNSAPRSSPPAPRAAPQTSAPARQNAPQRSAAPAQRSTDARSRERR